jgi:hypothetical protein
MGVGLSLAIVSLAIQMTTGSFVFRSATVYFWLLPALAASLYHLEQTHSAHVRIETSPDERLDFAEHAARNM